MYSKILLLFFILTFFINAGQSVDVTDCGSYINFSNVQVEGCKIQEDLNCTFVIGQTTTISFDVNVVLGINDELVNDVGFYLGDLKFGLSVTPENPCDELICPLQANYNGTDSAEIYIDPKYPPITDIDLKFIIKTATANEQLMCIQLPMVIQNAK